MGWLKDLDTKFKFWGIRKSVEEEEQALEADQEFHKDPKPVYTRVVAYNWSHVNDKEKPDYAEGYLTKSWTAESPNKLPKHIRDRLRKMWAKQRLMPDTADPEDDDKEQDADSGEEEKEKDELAGVDPEEDVLDGVPELLTEDELKEQWEENHMTLFGWDFHTTQGNVFQYITEGPIENYLKRIKYTETPTGRRWVDVGIASLGLFYLITNYWFMFSENATETIMSTLGLMVLSGLVCSGLMSGFWFWFFNEHTAAWELNTACLYLDSPCQHGKDKEHWIVAYEVENKNPINHQVTRYYNLPQMTEHTRELGIRSLHTELEKEKENHRLAMARVRRQNQSNLINMAEEFRAAGYSQGGEVKLSSMLAALAVSSVISFLLAWVLYPLTQG